MHPQLGVVFTLAPSLHSFWSCFSTLLQEHIGHLPTWGVHLSVSYLFAFSYCSWGSQCKTTEVVCHSLLHWTTFFQNSPPWPVHLGWPYMAWLIVSLIRQGCGPSDQFGWFFCDCGFHSVCLLMDKARGLWKLADGRHWLRRKLGLVLMGGALLSKSLF